MDKKDAPLMLHFARLISKTHYYLVHLDAPCATVKQFQELQSLIIME
jgi:hypothetical protein